jgi:hypothetical protein
MARSRCSAVTRSRPDGTIDAGSNVMADVLVEYDTLISAPDGSRWAARACGRKGVGKMSNMWEGWIECIPLDPGKRPVRSGRETTQPTHEDLVYWATGLTPTYLAGALERALQPPHERPIPRRSAPHFEGPAPTIVDPPSPPFLPHPILDPFDVYLQGEDLLIRQLDALDTSHLRDIARAYELMNAEEAESASRLDLANLIVTAARANATRVK